MGLFRNPAAATMDVIRVEQGGFRLYTDEMSGRAEGRKKAADRAVMGEILFYRNGQYNHTGNNCQAKVLASFSMP